MKMKDCKGNELEIGDLVAYIQSKKSGGRLDTGRVTKFYNPDGNGVPKACSVDNHPHVYGHCILKLQGKEEK